MTAAAALPFLYGSAATGTAAATSGLIGTAGAFSMGSALTTGLTLASGAMSIFGGAQASMAERVNAATQAKALEMTAREDLLSAKEEEIRGKQETNNILDGMVQAIATQRLSFAANGLDISFGTPVNVEEETRKIAGLQMGVTRQDALVRSLSRRRQAYARREEAWNVRTAGAQRSGSAMTQGFGNALGTASDYVMRRTERG